MKKLLATSLIVITPITVSQAYCPIGDNFYQCMEQERREEERERKQKQREEERAEQEERRHQEQMDAIRSLGKQKQYGY